MRFEDSHRGNGLPRLFIREIVERVEHAVSFPNSWRNRVVPVRGIEPLALLLGG
jgi:hypothetical protein